jgi:hypothetical protein
MELPISTIITLFVAISVGILVITFAQNLLSKTPVVVPPPTECKMGDLLEVKEIDETQIAPLVRACYGCSYGKALISQACYIVHSETPKALNAGTIKSAVADAVAGDKVVVSGVSSQTFYVKWNAADGTVEVMP